MSEFYELSNGKVLLCMEVDEGDFKSWVRASSSFPLISVYEWIVNCCNTDQGDGRYVPPASISLGERIKRARLENGITLDYLADKSGVSRSFIWEVEQGNTDISVGKLTKLATALGVSASHLIPCEEDAP